MKRLSISCAWLILTLAVAAVQPAFAQNNISLGMLRVALWPEYDRAAMLVIYFAELDDTVTYPATLEMRIPESVPSPFVVAGQRSPDGEIDELEYENTVEDGWRVISFEVGGPRFQLEYYEPFDQQGALRSYTYTWPGDYAVQALAMELQQPPHSSDLTTQPELPSSVANETDNLIYHSGDFGALASGETFTLDVSYARDTDELTAELLSALQSQTADPAAASSAVSPSSQAGQNTGGSTNVLLLVGVAVGFFLLGAATMRVAINIQEMNRQSRR